MDAITLAIEQLFQGQKLSTESFSSLFAQMLNGEVEPLKTAAFLTALRMKGESGSELAAAARILRRQMIALPGVDKPMLDTCGTGGDRSGTFNISTTVAIVVAGAGVPVVKHGNRSVSSNSGSSDVLSCLNVPIEAGTEWSQRCLEKFGLAFCYAPHFHPILAKVAPLRRTLGFRTIFNLLGPLLNPASAKHQLLGVGHEQWLDPLAAALTELGSQRAFLVLNQDGLDEIGLNAATSVRQIQSGRLDRLVWTNDDFGLPRIPLESVRVKNAKESAAIMQAILHNEETPGRYLVLANAAAGLWAVGRVENLREGVQQAQLAITSGAALLVLQQLQASTNLTSTQRAGDVA